MTSARLFLNLTSADFRRKKWLLVLWGYLCLMIFAVCLLADGSGTAAAAWYGLYAGPQNRFYGYGSCVMGTVLGLLGVSFGFSRRRTDFFLGLPPERGLLLGTSACASAAVYLLPMGLFRLAGYAAVFLRPELGIREPIGNIGKGIVVHGLLYLLFYGAAQLAGVLFGNVLTAVGGLAALLLYGPLMAGFLLPGYSALYFKSYYRSELVEGLQVYVSPFLLVEKLCSKDKGAELLLGSQAAVWTFGGHAAQLAAALLGTALLLGLSGVLFLRRPAEEAEQPVTFRILKAPLRFLLAVPGGLACGLLFARAAGQQGGFWPLGLGLVLGAVTVHGLLGVVYRSSLKGFCSGPAALGGALAVCCGVTALFAAVGGSYDSRIPGREELVSIGISVDGIDVEGALPGNRTHMNGQNEQSMELTGENLEAAYAWVQELCGTQLSPGDNYTEATVRFVLADGGSQYRRYGVADRETLLSFDPVYRSREYKEGVGQLPVAWVLEQTSAVWESPWSDAALNLSTEQKNTLYQCIAGDYEGLSLEQLEKENALGAVNWSYTDEPSLMKSPVYPSCTRTLNFLKGLGMEFPGTAQELAGRMLWAERTWYGEGGVPVEIESGIPLGEVEAERLVCADFYINPLLAPADENVEYTVRFLGESPWSFVQSRFYVRS